MKPYEIDVDFRRKFLSMRLRGFWDIIIFDEFAAEFENALRLLHRHGGCEVALVDGSEFAVQSRDILERFSKIMRDNACLLAQRTASIVPAELNRMQAAMSPRIAAGATSRRARRPRPGCSD